jgi:hypothetical protein
MSDPEVVHLTTMVREMKVEMKAEMSDLKVF